MSEEEPPDSQATEPEEPSPEALERVRKKFDALLMECLTSPDDMWACALLGREIFGGTSDE